MPGNAVLNSDTLIDDLVDVIDEVRGDVASEVGNRPFRVFTVLRTWTGDLIGDGIPRDEIHEIEPPPQIEVWNQYKWKLTPLGAHEDGSVVMTEVSLSYTFAQIVGSPVFNQYADNQQFFFWLVDAHGQGAASRALKLSGPPFADREKTLGWVIGLMDMNIPNGTEPDITKAT